MKKSIIWLLTIVMALTFGGLIYIQILYMEKMTRMRNEQFNENVTRALTDVEHLLQQRETLYYLEQDIDDIGTSFSADNLASADQVKYDASQMLVPHFYGNLDANFVRMQEAIRNQYLYQKGLLNEVILTIMRESNSRPVMERADSAFVRTSLDTELNHYGVNLPFEFAVTNSKDVEIYKTDKYAPGSSEDVYSCILFPNSQASYHLNIYFPTKNDYIYHYVRFLIPSLAFTLILLIVFLYTIIVAFRQKRLTEMKNDFINNMTHEFNTPISTISLAAQMLNDDSVKKSAGMLRHLAKIITDESKRLRFQVEKVLQLSMFDKRQPNLKFVDLNANAIISNVVHTFKIKVEKFGGDIDLHLDAENAEISVDEMHFTNVIFNILDNAVKYMKSDVDPHLEVSTQNIGNDKLEIRIKDNGIGIKKENLKRIFDKFYRVSTGNNHDVKGFGLGLAYVHKIITGFDGTIRVESEFGESTTFIITLPVIN